MGNREEYRRRAKTWKRSSNFCNQRWYIKTYFHKFLPDTQNISSCDESDETIGSRYGNLLDHQRFFVISPESIANNHREYKCEPYHKSNTNTIHWWDGCYEAGDSYGQESCRDKFTYHQFPHAFSHFVQFCLGWDFVSMMYSHPCLSKNCREPYGSKYKVSKRDDTDREPIEREVHRWKVRE